VPKEMEKKLKAQAKKKGFKKGSDRYNRYVYGTMQERTSWKPKRK